MPRSREELLKQQEETQRELTALEGESAAAGKAAESARSRGDTREAINQEHIQSLSEDSAHELIELLREMKGSLKGTRLVPEEKTKEKTWFDKFFE